MPILQKLMIKECTEAQAVNMALSEKTIQPAKIEPITIRSGKRIFAEIKANKGLLAITFKDPSNAPEFLEKIKTLLEEASKS